MYLCAHHLAHIRPLPFCIYADRQHVTEILHQFPKFRVTFHTSRHTFASLLLQDGVPMTTVQKLLGHKRATTTEIYAEVTDDTILSDLRRLSAPSKPQRGKRPKGKQ